MSWSWHLLLLLMILILKSSNDVCDGFAARSNSNNNRKRRRQTTTTSSGGGGGGGFGSSTTTTSTSTTARNKNNAKKTKNSKHAKTILRPPAYTVDNSQSIQNLMSFLHDEECEGLEITEVGISSNDKNKLLQLPLRGIYATSSIQPGEYICAIPFVSTLLIDEQFIIEQEEQDSKGNTLLSSSDRIDQGMNFLNKFVNDPEKSKFFKSYLDCLPQYDNKDTNFDATPEFWSDLEIQQLEIPSLVDDMIQRKQQLEMLATTTIQENNNNNNVVVDCNTLKHASWIVRTRAFTTLKKAMTIDGIEGLLQRTVLIPYLDLINHSSATSNAELQAVETKEYDESFYALVAKCHISKGQEIRITYGTGNESTLDIFTKYGFIPEGKSNQINDMKLFEEQTSLFSSIEWTTTLEEDETLLSQLIKQDLISSSDDDDNLSSQTTTMKTILNLRIYLKQLQQHQ